MEQRNNDYIADTIIVPLFDDLAPWFSFCGEEPETTRRGLVIPHVPEDKATQLLPLAEHLLQHVANPDVPISAKSAKVNGVRFQTINCC